MRLGGEAKKLARYVQNRGLDTYAEGRCESACTIVFIAGRDRAATPNARLGFHSPTGLGRSPSSQSVGRDYMGNLYREAGVSASFVKHALTVAGSDMWYPSRGEEL